MKTEILPFTEEMIPEAGSLLAQRHKRNRARLPFLPARFEDAQVAVKAVEKKFSVAMTLHVNRRLSHVTRIP